MFFTSITRLLMNICCFFEIWTVAELSIWSVTFGFRIATWLFYLKIHYLNMQLHFCPILYTNLPDIRFFRHYSFFVSNKAASICKAFFFIERNTFSIFLHKNKKTI